MFSIFERGTLTSCYQQVCARGVIGRSHHFPIRELIQATPVQYESTTGISQRPHNTPVPKWQWTGQPCKPTCTAGTSQRILRSLGLMAARPRLCLHPLAKEDQEPVMLLSVGYHKAHRRILTQDVSPTVTAGVTGAQVSAQLPHSDTVPVTHHLLIGHSIAARPA